VENEIKILLVDDDESIRSAVVDLLQDKGFRVEATGYPEQAIRFMDKEKFNLALIDFKMPQMNGIELMKIVKQKDPTIDVVMITGYATIEMAVDAMRLGAYDYIPKPFNADKLLAIIDKVTEKKKILNSAVEEDLHMEFEGKPITIIGKSPAMQKLFQMIRKVAPTDSTVLILGESGTGKELIAKAIHANSLRRNKPFYAMDCGSLVESLFESELFGHVKGSFTGAVATKHGAFELADGGTFFLDEIANISINLQAKILRAIQEKEIRRVGGNKTIPVDVRVIAATNIDLRRAVEEGKFREDLYYRLSVIPLHLPPLRERKEDIPLLIRHFIDKNQLKRKYNPIKSISDEAMNALLEYKWPGNIRELENVIERAVIIEESDTITLSSLPSQIRTGQMADQSEQERLPSLAEVEKQHIIRVLDHTNGNITQSAKILKIDRKTLYDKIRKYNIR